MGRFMQGSYWSGSGIYSSGDTHDLISIVEADLGIENVIAKKVILSSGSYPMSVKVNSGGWSAISPADSGSYILSIDIGDVYVSHLYVQQGSASGLSMNIIY